MWVHGVHPSAAAMRVITPIAAALLIAVSSCSASRDAGGPGTNANPNPGDGGFTPDTSGFNVDAPLVDGGRPKSCKVDASGDGVVGTCTKSAPPKSFTPRIKWTWSESTP